MIGARRSVGIRESLQESKSLPGIKLGNFHVLSGFAIHYTLIPFGGNLPDEIPSPGIILQIHVLHQFGHQSWEFVSTSTV